MLSSLLSKKIAGYLGHPELEEEEEMRKKKKEMVVVVVVVEARDHVIGLDFH